MPEEAAAGCLVGLFRFFAFIAEFVLEAAPAEFIGWIGRWTLRALTWGRSDRDSEDALCIMTGLFLIIALIAVGMWLY